MEHGLGFIVNADLGGSLLGDSVDLGTEGAIVGLLFLLIDLMLLLLPMEQCPHSSLSILPLSSLPGLLRSLAGVADQLIGDRQVPG